MIVKKEIAELFTQRKNFLGIFLAPIVLPFIFVAVYPSLIDELSKSVPLSIVIPKILDIFAFNYALFLILKIELSLATDMFIGEKMRKSIEVTLTTPIKVNDILAGKVLTTFIISYPVTIITFFGVAASIWAKYGLYLPSAPTFLYIFIILPIITLLLFALLGILQLSTRYYKVANAFFSLAMFLTIILPSMFIKEMPEAQDLLLIYVIICSSLGVLTGRLSQTLLDKEKVILSGG